MLDGLIEIDIKFAIKNVVTKRISRGATKDNLIKYLEHLNLVWRNSPKILKFIDLQKDIIGSR